MKVFLAELFGTFCLVLIGCGSAVIGGLGGILPAGLVGIGLAFGLAVTAMAYSIGPISGAHLNPAVSVGAFLAGRLPASSLPSYIGAQFAGGILGALVLWIIASGGPDGAPANLGANGWSDYSVMSVFLAETVATFVFVMVILGVTNPKHETAFAGLVIGLTLTILHIDFVNISGVSVNPARSLGPALFSEGAMSQLWLFLIAPTIGGALAGIVHKTGLFEKD